MDYRRPLLVFSCAVILLIATMVAGWGPPSSRTDSVRALCNPGHLPLVGPIFPGPFRRCNQSGAGLLCGHSHGGGGLHGPEVARAP